VRCTRWIGIVLLAQAVVCEATPADTVATRLAGANALFAEQWQWELRENPELATTVGDTRYNDRWSDPSPAHVEQQRRDLESFLTRFEAIDSSGFDEQDRLSLQLMVRDLRDRLRAIAFKDHEMPLDQLNGLHLGVLQVVDQMPFDSARNYEDYLARLQGIPHLFDALIEVLKQGERDGLMPPAYLLAKVAKQCAAIARPAGAANAFARPLQRFPDTVPAAERKPLQDAILATIDGRVRPAYRRLAAFVATDYARKGRAQPGLWSMPDGAARYRFAIHDMTTTDMDPQEIHALGLREVARIEAEMAGIAHAQGYSDLTTYSTALKADPAMHAASGEQILDLYRYYIAQMQPQLPKFFGLLPKSEVRVVPVQAYRQKEAAAAEYEQSTPDGSRPGMVYVNIGDFGKRPLTTIESTAYHEGVPGHHMQISIAQALPGLPEQRRQAGYNAYVEGWALYAEKLAKEMGFYKSPSSDYGRLCSELLRADRLVLDTGVHYKHWTRAQMIAFFRAHSCESEPDIQAETDRYIAWPAQALGYKLGELKFLDLRERARRTLGSRFDMRRFHDAVLDGGALPLDVLESRFDAWLERERRAAGS
jgi:uncharacterized protein (DUF885 family)